MFQALVILFGVSVFAQCIYAIKLTKDWANPVVLFSGIHLVHDWIQSLFYSMSDDFFIGGVLIRITDEMIEANLMRNFVAQWIFFLVFMVLYKRKLALNKNQFWRLNPSASLLPILAVYFIMTVVFISIMFFGAGDGEDQALTGTSAFNAFAGIMSIRSFFWIYALMVSALRQKLMILIVTLPLELILAGHGRKVLLMGLLCWLFCFTYAKIKCSSKFDILSVIWRGALMLIPAYLVLYIMGVRRNSDHERVSFIDGIMLEVERVSIMPMRVFHPLCSTNSEGVQIWCMELIKDRQLDLMYGKTYFQAFVNVFILRPFQGDVANWQGAYAFKMVAYPNISDNGWDFTFVAESYINWGNSGYLLSFVIFSVIFTCLYLRRWRSLFWQNFYFLFTAVCFVSFRTDSTALLRFLSYFVVVSMFASLFYHDKSEMVG